MERLRKTIQILASTSIFLTIFSSNSFADSHEPWGKMTIQSDRISSLTVTPYGLFAGEFDQRNLTPPAYNGLFKSLDHGSTWTKTGLEKKGVTSISYSEKTIFAGAFYTTTSQAGVYFSTDFGESWQATSLKNPISALAATDKFVLAGTYSHGLHLSRDMGGTWTQVLGSGVFGPQIKSLSVSGTKALAGTSENKVYLSTNSGETWSEIPFLKDKIISNLFLSDGVWIASTSNQKGAYKSMDDGKTWSEIDYFKGRSTGHAVKLKDTIFMASFSPTYDTYGIFKSQDNGSNWFDISFGLSDKNALSAGMAAIHSKPDKLFISTTAKGLFKLDILPPEDITKPFLDLPWKYQSFRKDVQRISSFFDHAYPLLGYGAFNEPQSENSTTTNYLGLNEGIPEMWYSSHNGIDFKLAYGTEIVAPAEGIASYLYGTGSGHTIKIDHGNGFQTWFMHLQRDGLAVSTIGESRWVKKLDVIGKVGMTGNTSGPHLHLSLLSDKDLNGNFDDFPNGLVDPYGWEGKTPDPWETFTWTDSLGMHQGSKSRYYWIHDLNPASEILNSSLASVSSDNKHLEFADITTPFNGTLELKSNPLLYGRGGDGLDYVLNSGTSITAYDITGSEVKAFDENPYLSISFDIEDVNDMVEQTLSMHSYDRNTGYWKKLDSNLSLERKTVSAPISSPGLYAIFGERSDTIPPQSEIKLTGKGSDLTYLDEVLVTLTSSDLPNEENISSIFYSLDDGEYWEKYIEPFWISEGGNHKILYKAIDTAENLEVTKSVEIIIVKDLWSKTVKIFNSSFRQ